MTYSKTYAAKKQRPAHMFFYHAYELVKISINCKKNK